jgi:predicted 3-demethylubiquinone-9 3-methyltransferase (glyoxalase superfamily)
MRFYVSIFPDSRIIDLDRYAPGEAGVAGSVKRALFMVAGQRVMCIDSPVKHAFGFTPAVSLFVDCASDQEQQYLHAALASGGTILMALDDYGFSRRFAWLNDRYGVSWQLNLK